MVPVRTRRPDTRYARLRSVALGAATVLGCTLPEASASPAQVDAQAVSTALQSVAERVSPGVVHIVARGYLTRTQGAVGLVERAQATGSGVILRDDGWIVTNAHVVLGAERIDVTVTRPPATPGAPRRKEVLPARLVALDIDSDLAVLKVEATDLPTLALADSNAVRPGQLVLAFGSPLGLEGSVSMGIVGAVDRQPDPDAPMVFIQTDAPINPGNSGGPLVDAQGRVIGINTFIVSTTGGNQGLGFAVPSDIVHSVFSQVLAEGTVSHGTIGLRAQAVTATLAFELSLPQTWGALVADVWPGSAADEAGIEVGDIVTSLDGDRIETGRELHARIHATRPGGAVALTLARGTKTRQVEVTVDALPGSPSILASGVRPKDHAVAALDILGIALREVPEPSRQAFRSTEGVLVLEADPHDPNTDGLLRGDVIVAVGQQPVHTVDQLRKALARARSGALVVLRVEREGGYRYLTVELD